MRESLRGKPYTLSEQLSILQTDLAKFVHMYEGTRPAILQKIHSKGLVVSTDKAATDALVKIHARNVLPVEPGQGKSQDEVILRMMRSRLEEATGEKDIVFLLIKDTNPDHASNPWWEFHETRYAFLAAEDVSELQKFYATCVKEDSPKSRVLAMMAETAIRLKTQG